MIAVLFSIFFAACAALSLVAGDQDMALFNALISNIWSAAVYLKFGDS